MKPPTLDNLRQAHHLGGLGPRYKERNDVVSLIHPRPGCSFAAKSSGRRLSFVRMDLFKGSLLCLLGLCAGASPAQEDCGLPWDRIGPVTCSMFVCSVGSEELTWGEARAICRACGGDLASDEELRGAWDEDLDGMRWFWVEDPSGLELPTKSGWTERPRRARREETCQCFGCSKRYTLSCNNNVWEEVREAYSAVWKAIVRETGIAVQLQLDWWQHLSCSVASGIALKLDTFKSYLCKDCVEKRTLGAAKLGSASSMPTTPWDRTPLATNDAESYSNTISRSFPSWFGRNSSARETLDDGRTENTVFQCRLEVFHSEAASED